MSLPDKMLSLLGVARAGATAVSDAERYSRLRKMAARSIELYAPAQLTSTECIPKGYLGVAAAPGGVYKDAWNAARAVSEEVYFCTPTGQLCLEQPEGATGWVVVPEAVGQFLEKPVLR